MAFDIRLYTFNKKTNSTLRPSGNGYLVKATVNAEISILSPTISLQLGSNANPTAYNYAYIPVFSRYYFINDWSFNAGLWYASLAVDALASWRDEIGAQNLYVERAAAEFDGRMADAAYPTTADFNIQSVPFVLKDVDQHVWITNGSYAAGTFVVGIIGRGGAVNYYAFPPANYSKFMSAVFNKDYGFTEESVKAIFNPIQYITSVVWLPFTVSLTGTTPVKMGWWTFADTAGTADAGAYDLGRGQVIGFSATVNLPKHPQQSRGIYLNGNPFTKYTLKFPALGMLDIQGADMLDSETVKLSVDVDLPTGKAILYIRPDAAPANTQLVEFNAGVTVNVSQIQSSTIGYLYNKYRESSPVNEYFANQFVGTGAALLDIVGSFTSIVGFDAGDKVSTCGTTGSMADHMIDGELIATFQYIAEEDNADKGRPLCAIRTVGNLSGYQKIIDTSIQIYCLDAEAEMIKSAMRGGFFYE